MRNIIPAGSRNRKEGVFLNKKLKILVGLLFTALMAGALLTAAGAGAYTDFLWFKNLGFVNTFMVLFFSGLAVRGTIGVLVFIFIVLNLFYTKKTFHSYPNSALPPVKSGTLSLIFIGAGIFFGFIFSGAGHNARDTVLMYLNQSPFGFTDPVFFKDTGFYVFSLPFYSLIRNLGAALTVLTLIAVGIIYTAGAGINSIREFAFKIPPRAKNHLTFLASIFLFLKAWDYRLGMYNLLFSPRGVVFGAGYADINASLPALRILFFIAAGSGLLLLSTIITKNYRLFAAAVALWFVSSLLLGGAYPALIQRFRVDPNELEMEREYIGYNIDMTNRAYGLDNVRTERFMLDNRLDQEAVERNRQIIDNIRIWDHRPKLSLYRELQELRPYYSFRDVDVDRYYIDGRYTQVMLSAREMNRQKLPSRTWINEKLVYTHGYGLVMTPVNRVNDEGGPEYLISDIPAVTETSIRIDNAAIYYGENTDDYVIANSRVKEFHYVHADNNVYRHYTGSGGVRMKSFFRKIIFALKFGEFKILLSDDIHSESRIMYYRSIRERVSRAAPFLTYDRDPYLVIEEGRLFWIQDAYTVTGGFPYSQPYGRRENYIRNSVKVLIDAYNGDMKFYVMDETDPLIRTYSSIYKDLFTDGGEMPDYIRRHIRYPEDLFRIQADIFKAYHMTDPTVFYNKEDLWDVPTEHYAGRNIRMQPYYILNKFPGNENAEFMLMLPFTPSTRNNMIAWMAARSDGDNYGQLLLYRFPMDQLVYGPQQIESDIDADDELSRLISLWSQRGSRVLRGNLLVIPIENSILYIEPLYIEAESVGIPRLRRVIASFDGRIAVARNLEEALLILLGDTPRVTGVSAPDSPGAPPRAVPENLRELSAGALEKYEIMKQSQRHGDWSRYGEALKELEEILRRLKTLAGR